MKKSHKVLIFSIVFLTSISIMIIFGLYFFTGIFQTQNIDKRDLSYWNYDETGKIINSEEFELEGKKEVCWLMIHSYASTPGEMRELANNLNNEFGDFIYAPRLLGHGEVPSKLINLELNDWHKQIELSYLGLISECEKINIVGSSFGAVLALKIAEEYQINNLFIINPYLSAGPIKDILIYLFSDSLVYLKKREVAKINDISGLNTHIAYWNFVLPPVKYSKVFINEVTNSLEKIEESVLLIHSTKDSVSDLKPIIKIKDKIGSQNFEMLLFDDSNHILLADYDRQETIEGIMFSSPNAILIEEYDEKEVIQSIIEFEKLKR